MAESNNGDSLTSDAVAVVGGGIAGLAASHYLTAAGRKVFLFESSDQFGGLGTFFSYHDRSFDRFYHCMLPGDEHLNALLTDLKINNRVYWKPANFGYLDSGAVYGLNTPLDLLRFAPLSLIDRFRVGFTGAYGSIVSDRGLDDITAADWLTRLSGRHAFRTFWKPMLEAKFGSGYDRVPALWFWTRFNREKGAKKEVKGYIRGGYKFIIDALTSSLTRRGSVLALNSPVESLDLDENGSPVVTVGATPRRFSQVVITTPLELTRRIAGPGLSRAMTAVDSSIDYQGVVNVILFMKRGISEYYWMAAINGSLPFQGVIESSVLLDREDTDGMHLVYLTRYLHRTDKEFQRSDEDIRDLYVGAMLKLFPQIRENDIIDTRVFRAPFVEPLYSTGYLKRKPPEELVPGKVFLATSTQVYPFVTSWDSSTGLARRVTRRLLSHH